MEGRHTDAGKSFLMSYVYAGTTGVEAFAGETMQRRPLTFGKPRLLEGEGKHWFEEDDDPHGVGRMKVEVYSAIRRPTRVQGTPVIVEDKAFDPSEVEYQGQKTHKCATLLGAESVTFETLWSEYTTGEWLETIEIFYGPDTRLMLEGVPPEVLKEARRAGKGLVYGPYEGKAPKLRKRLEERKRFYASSSASGAGRKKVKPELVELTNE